MKFGRNLPRNQVPQWASEYINYKGLKKLIKSAEEVARNGEEADLAEIFFTLDRNLEKVDGFYNKKYSELSRRLRLLYDRYGKTAPTPGRSEKEELEDVVNTLLDLRAQMRKLQWYGEVNRRGFIKITKKLDKKVPTACAQQRYLASRVDPRPFATNYRLSQDLNSINAWLSKLDDAEPLSDKASTHSSFSISRPLQQDLATLPQDLINRVDESINEDSPSNLSAAVEELKKHRDEHSAGFQRLLLNFLQRAIFSRSTKCIPTLLEKLDTLEEEDDFNKRNCLHRLLIHVGRARSSKANQATGQSSPELDGLSTVAPAEVPGLELNVHGLQEIESSRLPSGGDDTAELVTFILNEMHQRHRSALLERDSFGRIPLHYAAKYGFVNVCKVILERMFAWAQLDPSSGIENIDWDDFDGSTPLHFAVMGGWRLTTQTLLDACLSKHVSIDREHLIKTWSEANLLLAIATKANFSNIVRLLVVSGAEVNFQDEQGETALHIAARFGHLDCLQALLNGPVPTNLNIAEFTFGWTPVLIASVDGQLEIVQMLVEAGADLEKPDTSGWTAKEHAALRGHMRIAKLLDIHTPRLLPSPEMKPEHPTKPSSFGDKSSKSMNKEGANGRASQAVKSFGHRYLQGESMVLVSLGSMDAKKDFKPIELDHIPVSKAHSTQLDTALSLVVSANGASGDPTIVDLPVQDGISTEPMLFTTKDITKVKLLFDLVPTYSGSSDQSLGRGVAVLSSIRQNLGSKRMNLQGDISVPIVAAKTLDYIGTVNFNFLIITPFSHQNISITEDRTYWKSMTTPMVIGHRGLGKNMPSHKSLQLGENTIQSFIAAANLGATYVEFDVQLTKDLVPVIYHDFLVSETGIDAPVHALTLEQFLHASDSTPRSTSPAPPFEKEQSNGDSTNGKSGGRRPQRANSLGGPVDSRTSEMAERMKLTRDFKIKGFKGNSRGNFIQAPFTTLEEMFRKLPESTGFNIEMKYPMLFESEQEEMDTYAVELNSFVDTVLKMVYDLGGNRNVIFSSFHPDICLLLSLKQPSIPILFLTDAGVSDVGDVRASSLQEAIRFASRWNLLGLVAAAEPLVMCPRLVKVIKESGLVCVSYGTVNNDPKNVKLQVKEGIDAVIVDNVLAVRKGLTSDDAPENASNSTHESAVHIDKDAESLNSSTEVLSVAG